MINYQEVQTIKKHLLLALYESVGWTTYTKDPEKLQRAIEQSLLVITAWHEQTLIGLIRGIGDGETILYVQDLLLLPEYQNQGIGKELVDRLLAVYPEVRQKVLMTDEAPNVRHFYEKCGFISADKGSAVAFFKYDY